MDVPAFSRVTLPAARTSLAIAAVAAMVVMAATFGLRIAEPAGAQDPGNVFEMTSEVPARGYWLPGDSVAFRTECATTGLTSRWDASSLGSSGWSGSSGWGVWIAPWAHEGIHLVEMSCGIWNGTEYEVVASETLEVEVGPVTSLRATVGTEPGECAATEEITVDAGTEVFWCYTLEVNPELPDDWWSSWLEAEHEVSDVSNGLLGTHVEPVGTLTAGLSNVDLGFVSSSVIDETTENTGTWLLTASEEDWEVDDDSDRYPFTPMEATARVIVEGDEVTATTEPGTPTTQPSGPAEAPAAAAPATPQRANPAFTG